MWILLTLTYGTMKGVREICKKKAMEKSSLMEVLFFYTLLSFVLVTPDFKNAIGIPVQYLPWIALKSLLLFVAWILSFKAVKYLPLSLYGVLDLSRILLATLLAVFVLGEICTAPQLLGLGLVCCGLLCLRNPFVKIQEKVSPVLVLCAIGSCFLNAVSSLLDKKLMANITASQLQFWFLLFMVLYDLVYVLVTKTKLDVKSSVKNPWIILLAILFVIADRCLFIANSYPESKITIMTLLKQASAIVSILAGRFVFKEKHTTHKLLCAAIIIAGIVISAL